MDMYRSVLGVHFMWEQHFLPLLLQNSNLRHHTRTPHNPQKKNGTTTTILRSDSPIMLSNSTSKLCSTPPPHGRHSCHHTALSVKKLGDELFLFCVFPTIIMSLLTSHLSFIITISLRTPLLSPPHHTTWTTFLPSHRFICEKTRWWIILILCISYNHNVVTYLASIIYHNDQSENAASVATTSFCLGETDSTISQWT
jgi:hypothetical protein